MQNRLAFLMDEIGYKKASRKVSEKTGVSYSTLYVLSNEQRTFSFNKLDKLCIFFNVSMEFMTGVSENGYYVYISSGKKINLTYKEALKYKQLITVKEVPRPGIDENSDELPKTYIRREISMTEFIDKMNITEQIKNRIDDMDYYQLKDLLNLIEKYILK